MPHATARVTGALTAAAAAASLLLWAVPASADELSGGRLDWGVKESFRSYITGSIAQGEIQTGDGASTVDGSYRFHSASGTYEDGTAEIDYQGWVYFWGHDGELDLTFANPSVEYSGSSGTLYVYVNGSRTDMATLGGASLESSGGTVSVSGASAVLTANGADAFEGYYEAGQELDPVTFSADLVAEEETEAAEESTSAAPQGDEVSGAVVDWGVRTSWRDYVSGDIANGEWTVSGGAADGGAVFRFTEGTGTATASDYELAFKGTVTFTGTNVDLAITDPVITATDGEGVLSAEVGGTRVDLVTFEAELTETDGVLLAEDVPTALTEDAEAVFGGFYQAGDAMDTLLVAVPLSEDAEVPALPDLGSDPVEASSSATAEEIDADDAGTESGTNPLVWIIPAMLALILGVTVAVIAFTRRAKRKRQQTSDGEASPEEPSETTPSEDPEGEAGGQAAAPAASSVEDAEADKEK